MLLLRCLSLLNLNEDNALRVNEPEAEPNMKLQLCFTGELKRCLESLDSLPCASGDAQACTDSLMLVILQERPDQITSLKGATSLTPLL